MNPHAMRLRLRNTVLLAEDYERLRDWYVETLGLDVAYEADASYRYAELASDGRLVLGIAVATEMGTTPGDRRGATALPQLDVEDVPGLLAGVEAAGGRIVFGPKHEPGDDSWYGAFLDIEGNQVWVVQVPGDGVA